MNNHEAVLLTISSRKLIKAYKKLNKEYIRLIGLAHRNSASYLLPAMNMLLAEISERGLTYRVVK